MQAASSILNELDFYQKWLCSARLEGLDDPCLDSLLDCVMGKYSSVVTALGVPVASLKCCGWPGCRVIPLASNVDWFRSAAGCCQEGQAAGSCLRDGSEGPQCCCSLFAQWLYGKCLTSPWTCFPLWSAHITYKQSCVSRFSASKCWRSSKNISFIQTAVVAVPEFDKGLYPDMSPAPLLWSGCLFLLHPFNDTRCNQEAAETQLHNWLSGFLFGRVTLHAVCMLTFRNLGIFC